MPIPRFGSSDYRRSRTSRLFYSRRQPSFQRFQQAVSQAVANSVEVQQYSMALDNFKNLQAGDI